MTKTKLLVLYYSMYGHIEAMANAVVEGAKAAGDIEVSLKRVPHAKRQGTDDGPLSGQARCQHGGKTKGALKIGYGAISMFG